MRISTWTTIRFLTLAFLSTTLLAAAVGRLSPNPYADLVVDHGQPWTVAQHVIDPGKRGNLILEPGRDNRVVPDFGAGVAVDLLSVSPFADAFGRREMIGRSRHVEGSGITSIAVRVEMSRYSYPDATLIESRETEWMPTSVPTWDVRVDRGLKTIFSTGAGFLVRLDWTDDRGHAIPHRGERIAWSAGPPFGEATFIGDPVWVTDPRYPDRLIVNFWGRDERTQGHHAGLAWIELNRQRTAIVDFGILLRHEMGPKRNAMTLRAPSMRLDSQGRLHMLWLERAECDREWSLHKAELIEEPREAGAGAGWRLAGDVRLATNCMPVPACLDESLRYAYFVVPRSESCYDGGTWRKARVGEPGGQLVHMGRRGVRAGVANLIP